MVQITKEKQVRIAVRDKIFTTTEGTLRTCPSLLSELLDQSDGGQITVDGDAKYFRYVMNFLRDGCIALPDEEDEEFYEIVQALKDEAEYYRIPSLRHFIEHTLSSRIAPIALERGDRVVWRDSCLARLLQREDIPIGVNLPTRTCAECESEVDEGVIALTAKRRAQTTDVGRVRKVCGNGSCVHVSFGCFAPVYHLPTRWLTVRREA